MKKKVLYVVTKSNWGGAQRYVFDLASNLPKDRSEAVVVAGGSGPLIQKLKESGIRTISVPSLDRDIDIFKEFTSLVNLYRIFAHEKPDAVHLNSTKAGGLGAVAACIAGVPKIVFTVHGWGFKEDRPFWQKWIIYFLTWFGSIFQDEIITISTADYDTGKKFISPKKLHLIFNGIETFKFLSFEAARETLGKIIKKPIEANTLVLGTIAEYTKNKGLPELLEALVQIRKRFPKLNWQAFLVGEGEDREKLAEKIISLKLETQVHLTGFLPDASRYIPGFDIFVLPSRKEGLPYVLLEAMSAGVAVAGSRVGGIPDIIKDGQDGFLFNSKQAKDIISTVSLLIENKELRQKLGSNAARKMQTEFKLENMIDETLSLYE